MCAVPDKAATCRGCGRRLILSYDGFRAHNADGTEAKVCFYGDFVCCRACDVNACVRMESSFPGAGPASRPGCFSMRQIRNNWDEEG